MARHDIAGILKSAVLGAALVAGSAPSVQAQVLAPGENPISPFAGGAGNQLELSASTALTTDYVFRGISQTDNQAAIQGSLDAAYGIFYAGIWASNLDFGGGPNGQDIANIEIDYYAGITPSWWGLDFDIGGIYYTYPGAYDPGGNFDYFELKTGVSYAFDKLTVGVTNYWAPEFFGQTGENITDYTFWNVGLTLGFMENFAADIRYWDTDFSTVGCGGLDVCDERVVGTLSASF
jgi:uncharacterized protein (TIGR02001 family)